MRVLVTGASGHVGGAIARHLHSEGHTVVGLSRRVHAGLPAAIEQIPGDIATGATHDGGLLEREVFRCDAIVHAAACMDASDDMALLATNAGGTQRMARLARLWGCSHFIYISGVSVIGTPRIVPITEDHPTRPASLYVATKLFGESLAGLLETDMASLSLRLPSPIGPGLGARRIVGTFIQRALAGEPLLVHGTGGRQQNYLDVRDVASAVSAGLKTARRGVVQIGAAEAISNMALARNIVDVLSSTSVVCLSGEPDAGEALVWQMDCARAKEWLEWAPRYALEQSIRDMARDASE